MLQLGSTALLPAAITYQKHVADTINSTRAASPKADVGEEEKLLIDVSSAIGRMRAALTQLKSAHEHLEEKPDAVAQALHSRDQILPAMADLRAHADRLEGLVDDSLWPLPKYHELLFLH
jgi:glutamine synthetase